MGFKSGETIKDFEPLELSEANVQAIFKRCGKANEDGHPELDEEKLKASRANIRYLLEQLALVHEGVKRYRTGCMFAVRYDGKCWTEDITFLDILLNLGERIGVFSFFKKDSQQFVELELNELNPTLSPNDPKFAAWWESADSLMVRAQAAKDEDKLDEALSLYEKAAQQGNVDAQYIFFEDFEDFELEEFKSAGDYESAKAAVREALYRYEEAAKQGDASAQFSCGLMYYYGEGTAMDSAKAKLYFQRAAAQTESKELQEWEKIVLREYF